MVGLNRYLSAKVETKFCFNISILQNKRVTLVFEKGIFNTEVQIFLLIILVVQNVGMFFAIKSCKNN